MFGFRYLVGPPEADILSSIHLYICRVSRLLHPFHFTHLLLNNTSTRLVSAVSSSCIVSPIRHLIVTQPCLRLRHPGVNLDICQVLSKVSRLHTIPRCTQLRSGTFQYTPTIRTQETTWRASRNFRSDESAARPLSRMTIVATRMLLSSTVRRERTIDTRNTRCLHTTTLMTLHHLLGLILGRMHHPRSPPRPAGLPCAEA